MDGFTYQNIFETKGIEYIIVIVFLSMLIPFWILLHKRSKRLSLVNEAFSLSLDALKIPQGVFFGRNHTWLHLQKNGKAKIGLDDMLMHATGLVNINFIAEPGCYVQKGDLIAELDHQGNKLQIRSPLSGEIKKANRSLSEHPELMNNNPFTEGWMYEIKPDRWIPETSNYVLGEKANSWMKSELSRFKDFVMGSAVAGNKQNQQVILQDGGELRDHTLQKLPPELWKDFQKNFLDLS